MATEATNGAAAEVQSVTFTGLKPQVFVEASKQLLSSSVSLEKAQISIRSEISIMLYVSSSGLRLSLTLLSFVVMSTGLVFCLETEDIEAAVDKAVKAGAEGDMTEGEGAWFGGRVGKVKDPYGIVWLICAPAKKCDVEA
ncbi:uncharacterized protein At5g48480-like [Cynara cardunculus var. scolymus]|uniref:uncharacterized protein At5g48480-like n=1 Tax=Cynara cardunculus var. scolymus TaxID=59895 RepID=UPI000D627474|nr:uncharacterized protein At5g48480-like [Cynara cardunculus var. scolymus]